MPVPYRAWHTYNSHPNTFSNKPGDIYKATEKKANFSKENLGDIRQSLYYSSYLKDRKEKGYKVQAQKNPCG